MSDASTRRMIARYMEEASAPMFLSSFFTSPPANFHNSEKIELDVVRDDEEVAIAIKELGTGAHENEANKYTNKAFTPAIFSEQATITAWDQLKRQPGDHPFEDPEYQANAVIQAFGVGRKLERKIRRGVELMSSQVLQTGMLVLKDAADATMFQLDFKPKSSHFPTALVPWSANSGTDRIGDVKSLATSVRREGKSTPNRLLFGALAWQQWRNDTEVRALLDNLRINVGSIAPQTLRDDGAVFQGTIFLDQYQFEMWTYDGFYRDPVSGLHVPYLGEDKVVMLSRTSRLDLSWGGIPRIVPPDPRAMPYLPQRMSSPEAGLDLHWNAYVTPNGRNVALEVSARPLTIPTAIDTYGCLTVSDPGSS